MLRELAIAAVLAASPGAVPGSVDAASSHRCRAGHSWAHPSRTIRVLRIHHRGLRAPKRIEVWDTEAYDAAVMASGAWPNRVRESAKVGAVMIRNWAQWQTLNTCRTWRGHRYDITDSEQYLRPGIRPWSKLPTQTKVVVHAMRRVHITKNGHHLRLGWRAAGGRCGEVTNGYYVWEDGARDCARKGMRWAAILRRYLMPRLVIHWRRR